MHRIVPNEYRANASADSKVLYLSFDDGPDPIGTPATLEVLACHQARASFFLVAEQAGRFPHLIQHIQSQGHSLGNHSLDHSWRPFFRSQDQLQLWIERSETLIQKLSGHPTLGFRSPAGVVTPPLKAALKNLDMPLIHWNRRFFDALWSWEPKGALQSLRRTPSGSIVLLHDKQKPGNLGQYLKTLHLYLAEGKALDYRFEAIPYGLPSSHRPMR